VQEVGPGLTLFFHTLNELIVVKITHIRCFEEALSEFRSDGKQIFGLELTLVEHFLCLLLKVEVWLLSHFGKLSGSHFSDKDIGARLTDVEPEFLPLLILEAHDGLIYFVVDINTVDYEFLADMEGKSLWGGH